MFNFKLSIDQINYLNIALMIISAATALIWPFETFLFVYAFLGPLHYLTEISWLHDKKYYTKRKYDYLFLIGASVIITLMYFQIITNVPIETSSFITYMAFMAALFFVIFKNWTSRLIAIFIAALVSNFIIKTNVFDAVFSYFLPTLIHVFIFTALFILIGALRGRSFSGIASLVVFAIVTIGLLAYHPVHTGYQVSNYVKSSYGYLQDNGSWTKGFIDLNQYIFSVFKLHDFGKPAIPYAQYVQTVNNYLYHAPLALSLMSFIGFAYMYHYLNWFSKTSIIQWQKIPKARFIAVIALWVASLALYAYDYAVGLDWLFFLSFSHVLLEFPLNHLTFINIGKEIGNIITGKKTVKAPVVAKPITQKA